MPGTRAWACRLQHLAELHRRRILVPLLRIVQRSSKASPPVPVAASAMHGYGQYRSPIALVTAAAAGGLLVNPGRWSAAVVSGCASLAQALARPRGSHRPEHAMANGFANETRRYGRDGAKRRRCSPSRPPGQQDALRRQRHRRRTSYGSSPSDQQFASACNPTNRHHLIILLEVPYLPERRGLASRTSGRSGWPRCPAI